MRQRVILLAMVASLYISFGPTARASLPFSKCVSGTRTNRFAVSSSFTTPSPYTYCFNLQLSNCSNPSSKCCKNSDVAKFLLGTDPACDGTTITATLNNIPVAGVTIGSPPLGPSTARVLTVPGLSLNATSIGSDGATLCLTLPSSGDCNSLFGLAGGKDWSAGLVSSDSKCCPVTDGRTAPPIDTCWVMDVQQDSKAAGAYKWDFLSRTSCGLSYFGGPETNCCEKIAKAMAADFDYMRTDGTMLKGFDNATCDRTSIRFCGRLLNKEVAGPVISQDHMAAAVQDYFGVSDDTCPMALMNSTVRFYNAKSKTGKLDSRFPSYAVAPAACVPPNRVAWYRGPSYAPFPHGSCLSSSGSTPFAVEPYLERIQTDHTDLYCVAINTTTPDQPKSACGSTTRIDRVSFWLWDDRKENYLAVYLLTQRAGGGQTKRTLNTYWGPTGDRALFATGLALDLATVQSSQPKICIERPRYLWSLSGDSADASGYIWTALYDSSGACCPTYYANEM